MSTLFGIPIDLAYHAVSWIAVILAPLFGGLAAVAAIIVFTMAVRLVLVPLSYYAVRGEAARARMQPRIAELQRRHAGNPERLQRELAAFYKAEGSAMFSGCLPALIQIPFFSVVYRLFVSTTVKGKPNLLLSHHLLGAALGAHWLGGGGALSIQGLVFGGLFVLLAVIGLASLRAARRAAQATTAPAQPGTARPGAGRLMNALTKAMPFAPVVMAAVLPLAAGVYLLVSTTWTLTERAIMRRRLGRASTTGAGAAV
jgi:YidC/Oxa1 family membrane protein insertase